MAKKMMHLIFPQRLIKKPVIYTMAKKYGVIPNIRRAKITEAIGEVTLELDGTKKLINIDSSVTDIASFQSAVDNAFGQNKVVISDIGGGQLGIDSKAGSGVNKIILTAGEGTTNALTSLGFAVTDNLSNRIKLAETLETASTKMKNAIKEAKKGDFIGVQLPECRIGDEIFLIKKKEQK